MAPKKELLAIKGVTDAKLDKILDAARGGIESQAITEMFGEFNDWENTTLSYYVRDCTNE